MPAPSAAKHRAGSSATHTNARPSLGSPIMLALAALFVAGHASAHQHVASNLAPAFAFSSIPAALQSPHAALSMRAPPTFVGSFAGGLPLYLGAARLQVPSASGRGQHVGRGAGRSGGAVGLGMQSAYTFGVEDLKLVPGGRVFLVGADIRRSKYKTLERSWELQVR